MILPAKPSVVTPALIITLALIAAVGVIIVSFVIYAKKQAEQRAKDDALQKALDKANEDAAFDRNMLLQHAKVRADLVKVQQAKISLAPAALRWVGTKSWCTVGGEAGFATIESMWANNNVGDYKQILLTIAVPAEKKLDKNRDVVGHPSSTPNAPPIDMEFQIDVPSVYQGVLSLTSSSQDGLVGSTTFPENVHVGWHLLVKQQSLFWRLDDGYDLLTLASHPPEVVFLATI